MSTAATSIFASSRRNAAKTTKRLQDRLEEQANALKEADRRKNEFLAILAHELRNPLAAHSQCRAGVEPSRPRPILRSSGHAR